MTGTVKDQEMRDLLIRLDQQVKDGFTNMNTRFDNSEGKIAELERRTRTLETSDQNRAQYVPRFEKVETLVQSHENRWVAMDGASKFARVSAEIGRGILGILIGAGGALTLTYGFPKIEKPEPPKTEQHSTVTPPKEGKSQ